MKTLLLLIGILFCTQGYAQKYYTKTGQIDFEASVPAFEPVKASHKTVTALLDANSGEIAILSLMKGFRFRNALMEEHFNENYMESDTYPKAVFKGTVIDFSKEGLDNNKSFTVKGTLTLHGKTKDVEAVLDVKMVANTLVLKTTFSVAPEEFDIEIPGVVSEKISDKILITADFTLVEK
ncbi:YceI family protein [Dokdonia ponticola]|uniref:YceI family protein n=1 Tax=Dokdonia ponticola TaxID=2041041 RepID=A0ABV9HZI1_9FLAO